MPSHLLEDLLSDVQSELQQVKRITTNSKELRALEAAKNWLEEVQGAVVAQFEATEYERLSSSSSDEVAIALRTRKPDSYRLLPERVGYVSNCQQFLFKSSSSFSFFSPLHNTLELALIIP